MKKTYLNSFCARCLTLLVLALLSTNLAWGDEVTMAYSGSTTTNMTGNNDAATVGLNADSWSVVGDKGGNNNFPGLNKAGRIHMYGSSTNHNTITVTNSDNYKITSIKVTYGTNNYNAKVTAGNAEITGTGSNTEKTYTINSTSFSIAHNYSTTTQVYIISIVITYQTGPTKLSAPTGLQSANVTQTSANLSWTDVANALRYTLAYKKTADTEFTETAFTSGSTLSDLSLGTEYTWKVKAVGDGTSYETSDYSETSTFTTVSDTKYTVTFNAGTNGTCETTSLTEASAGAGVELPSCTPNQGYAFLGWSTSETPTSADAGEAGEIYHPTDNVTLYAVYKQLYTINYMVNGVNTGAQENVVEGTPLVFPEVSAPDADHVFRGWVTKAIEGTQPTAPEYVNTEGLTATEDATYYAVFAEKEDGDVTWNVVTDANGLQVNDVIIISTNNGYTAQSMKTAGTISDKNLMSCKASTYNSDKTQITSVADGTLEFTLGGNSTDGWTLQNGSNYLGMSGDKKVALSTTSSTWSISISNSVATLSQTYDEKSYSIQYNYNQGNDRFTGYTSSQVAISLYKKTQDITYSNYCTTVAVKELTSITIDGEYPTEFWKGEAFSHEGMTVTAHYSDADDADVTSKATFSGYNMNTAGKQTVTVTYEGQTATYDITVKTIANTKETAYTVAQAIELIDAGNDLGTEVYVKGIVSKIETPWSEEFNNITYNISEDGETTSQQFQLFRCVTNGAVVGDYVIAKGKLQKYGETYEFTSGNTIVNESTTVTITAAKYATLGLPYAVTIPEGVSAYTATVSGNVVTLNPIEGTTIPADCGVILKANAGNYKFTETTDVAPIEGNNLVAVTAEGGKDINGTTEGIYFLSTNTNGVVFKLANSGNIPQYKAYLQSAGSEAKLDVVFGDVTGIKTIDNGQLTIDNSKAYNLNGVRVNENYKGIIIVNGKKYINK